LVAVGPGVPQKKHTMVRHRIAAVRDFNPADVRVGSITAEAGKSQMIVHVASLQKLTLPHGIAVCRFVP
jgi:hypothetical protein